MFFLQSVERALLIFSEWWYFSYGEIYVIPSDSNVDIEHALPSTHLNSLDVVALLMHCLELRPAFDQLECQAWWWSWCYHWGNCWLDLFWYSFWRDVPDCSTSISSSIGLQCGDIILVEGRADKGTGTHVLLKRFWWKEGLVDSCTWITYLCIAVLCWNSQ